MLVIKKIKIKIMGRVVNLYSKCNSFKLSFTVKENHIAPSVIEIFNLSETKYLWNCYISFTRKLYFGPWCYWLIFYGDVIKIKVLQTKP